MGDKCLIISPHQDDEILGCSTIITRNDFQIHDIWFIIKGGGFDPSQPSLVDDELYKVRNQESLKALSIFPNVNKEVKFFGIKRPLENEFVTEKQLEKVCQYLDAHEDEYRQILITSEFDKHIEHQRLAKVIKEFAREKDFEHKILCFYISKEQEPTNEENKPVIEFELTDTELKLKKELIKNFKTQKHFVMNLVERDNYKWEKFYAE